MKAAFASALLAATVAAFVAWPRDVMSHGSVTTTVLFDREIVRILNDRCVMCHADASLSFPLLTYEQTWLQGRSMRSSVLRRHMPPWPAVAGYGEFINDNRLTLRETQFLVSWVEGLGPRNAGKVFLNVVDPGTRPSEEVRATAHTGHWQMGQPDLVRRLSPTRIEAGQGDVVRRQIIDPGLTSEREVRALEFMPGDRRVVRAASFSVEGTGQWLASWTPWHGFVSVPDGAAYRLSRGSRIVADVHYRAASDAVVDQGTLGIFFSAKAARPASDLIVDAGATRTRDQGSRTLRGRVRLNAGTNVWALQPEIVVGLSSLEVSARRPDGGTDVLLALTDPPIAWPTPYLLKTPRALSRGTEIFVVARFNGSPPPSLRVRLSRY
jgi:hypothetical protein